MEITKKGQNLSVKFGYPAGTRRNNNVIMTSKRRRDVIITLLLCRVPVGYVGLSVLSSLSEELQRDFKSHMNFFEENFLFFTRFFWKFGKTWQDRYRLYLNYYYLTPKCKIQNILVIMKYSIKNAQLCNTFWLYRITAEYQLYLQKHTTKCHIILKLDKFDITIVQFCDMG